MSVEVSERSFEETIESELLAEDAAATNRIEAGGDSENPSGGYRKGFPENYDRSLCLMPRDTIDFLLSTQPNEWSRLKQHHGSDVDTRFLKQLSREIERRGVLDVLRKGVKDSGCSFALAFFLPSSGLNENLFRLSQANIFSICRQFKYSERNEKSLDLVIFLNGIPLFTAELKNPLTGQTVKDAVDQYRFERDPREPIFAFRRCLAHFAVDPELVYVATRIEGPKTRFLPFNQGKFGGAGNPPRSPTDGGYATDYLWRRIWSPGSVLDLLSHFIHEVEEEDESGRRTGKRILIFPRYHQLDAVRRLVRQAREKGAGESYLIQHSAGSGKSNSIAWLAHRLSVLHDEQDKRVFDSIVVITDRRVLDRQLQRTVLQFQQTLGIVENIDTTSRQLREALEAGKTIIVTTLQKFPVISSQIREVPGKRFAVIVDEAHSSQSGESARSLHNVLAAESLEAAEAEEADEAEDLEDRIVAEMRSRGKPSNVSFFAFTATPKAKTLELFSAARADGKFEAFSLYTMRQAIEEGFILDVLENYTTYKTFWRLLKTIADDPRYDREKASYLLRSFVDLHAHAIQKKVDIIVCHFHDQVAHRIGGRAKAMIVTRSRLHAVRYKLAMDQYLAEKRLPYTALVAFSGQVKDGGIDYSEAGMNGFPETQTAETFKRAGCRFFIVAEKFQTGFDQSLLHTMYVDKKLGGVHAVQTLSRLNRVHPGKNETMVLDFANEADEIVKAFAPYYEKTLLSEATDPNILYDMENRLYAFPVFSTEDVDSFAKLYFGRGTKQDKLYAALGPSAARFREMPEKERKEFQGILADYVRLYVFLSQIIAFADPSLEKLYVFTRLLRRLVREDTSDLPLEIRQSVDMESYRLQRTFAGSISLPRGEGDVRPIGEDDSRVFLQAEEEPLSQIIRELNERFGTDFTQEDRVFIEQLEEKLAGDSILSTSVRVNPPENARLAFDQIVTGRLQDMVDSNFKFYKRLTDDKSFAAFFLDWLFDRFEKSVKKEAP